MPCEPSGGIENCLQVQCPCKPDCTGLLDFAGPNLQRTLVFLECSVCHCAYIAGVAATGDKHLQSAHLQSARIQVLESALGAALDELNNAVGYNVRPDLREFIKK